MVRGLAPENSQELQIACVSPQRIPKDGVNIVLTAFEPLELFGNVRSSSKTACWECIQLLNDRGITYKRPVVPHCYQLRNIYDFISKQISRCWEKHQPVLMVIVGQHGSGEFNEIVLEKIATNTHVLNDQIKSLAKPDCCTNSGPRNLETELNLDDTVAKFHAANTGVTAKVASTYKGYYLCDYAYYNSLHINRTRTVCIRVPDNDNIAPEHLADAISFCITDFLQQLDEKFP